MNVQNKTNQKMIRTWGSTGAIVALLSVAIGAFAAHGLKASLTPYQLGIMETGAKYQMYHGLAILVVLALSLMATPDNTFSRRCFRVNQIMCVGVVLFSGSLYALALTGIKVFALITPIGGVCLLAAWAWLAYSCYSIRNT